jgi:hypothetical protein
MLRSPLLPYPVSVNSKGYELLVREIYQQMLDQDQASNVVVQHNVHKQGRSTSHQIDVYWEFCLGGITHQVAVQAKNWNSPIRKGDVLTFKGVLEDIPGTVGIMVTSSRYQKGAFEVANAAGIVICNLQEDLLPPVSMYPGETATFAMKGLLKARNGDHLGMLVEVTQKIPELSDVVFKADSEWHPVNNPLPESISLTNVPSPFQFYDQDGKELFTLTRILGEFYEEMHREGQMSARKTRRFEQPTFLKLSNPPMTIKEESVSATIVFRPKRTEVVFKAQNVAVFILKNLIGGAEHRFVAKKP